MNVDYKKNDPELLGFAFLPFLIPAAGAVVKGIFTSAAQKKQAKAAAAAAKIKAENDAKMLKIGMIVGIPSLALLLIFKGKKKNDSPIQSR
jgi:hypothetical protein